MDHVFIIEFSDEDQNTSIDSEAYSKRELAEQSLNEMGYEKKLNWSGDWFFENRNKVDNYANILKLEIRGV